MGPVWQCLPHCSWDRGRVESVSNPHPRYPHVFSPIKLGPVEVPNRFYFPPHGVALAVGTKPSNDFVAYSAARVRDGGAGLVVNSLTVHDRPSVSRACPYPPQNVPAFRAMADGVHAAGGRIFGELLMWWGVGGFWQPLSPPAPSFTASAVQYELATLTRSTHEMSRAEIRAMVAAYGQSTANLRAAGYDGVMLHAAHGALLEHFVSPYFNRRTDEYGGSRANRMRFLIECLEVAHDAADGKIAVGMRFNCDELLPGGYDTAEAREILGEICASGLVDFVDLDIAVEPQQLHLGMPPVFVEPRVYEPYVQAVRPATGDVPVLSVLGRLTSIAEAETALASGVCDMVGAARALIAEPELVKNARIGQEDRSRTCIACNWCMAARTEGAQGCAINPASYRERHWGVGTFTPAPEQTKVVVVGAGPAGLEAARVSALRGHHVVLMEARDVLGGALRLWASLPAREWYLKAVEWWQRELERLGVEIRCGTSATGSDVLAEAPGAVIVATGARYSPTGRSAFLDADIPGHDRDFVHRPEDVLIRGIRPEGSVVLLDGEGLNTGGGVAELLATHGARVTYLTPGFAPASASLVANHDFNFVVSRIKRAGVNLVPTTYIRRIDNHQVVAYDVFTDQETIFDDVSAVVLATAREPVSQLARDLDGHVAQLFAIGDAAAVRPWAAAAFEGQKFARCIGEPGAPTSLGEAYFGPDDPLLIPLAADATGTF